MFVNALNKEHSWNSYQADAKHMVHMLQMETPLHAVLTEVIEPAAATPCPKNRLEQLCSYFWCTHTRYQSYVRIPSLTDMCNLRCVKNRLKAAPLDMGGGHASIGAKTQEH